MKPIVQGLNNVWVHCVGEVSLVQDHVLPPDIGGEGVACGAIQAGGTLVVAAELPRRTGGDQRGGTKKVRCGETKERENVHLRS